MANFGVSFVPTDANLARPGEAPGGAGGGLAAGSPFRLQQAIKLLSLRLPRVVGGTPIAPAPLLGAPGAAGLARNLGAPIPGGMGLGAAGAGPTAPSYPQPDYSAGGAGPTAPTISGAEGPIMRAIAMLAGMQGPPPGGTSGLGGAQLPSGQYPMPHVKPIEAPGGSLPGEPGYVPPAAPAPTPYQETARERFQSKYDDYGPNLY